MSTCRQEVATATTASIDGHWSTGVESQDCKTSKPPRLGIDGYHVAGSGEYVLTVEPHSEAERIGLKSGDLIVAANGRPLENQEDWLRAIRAATAADGTLSLLVHDGHTGRIHCRRGTIFSPPWA